MTRAPFNLKSLEDYVAEATQLFGLAHSEQQSAWVARLGMHLPDMQRINSAACSPDADPIGLPVSARTGVYATPTLGVESFAQHAFGLDEPSFNAVDNVKQGLAQVQSRPELNAFEHVAAEAALEKGRLVDALHSRSQQAGVLAGVTLAVKACFEVQGLPMTSGTRALPSVTPDVSAPCVARLESAGAIVLGMTTMHELAYGATTDNPHVGRVGHPADPDRVPGGSSGGSAVAVATGMANAALGTDTAGSVRMPAALCGIVGFKPSYGLISCDGMLPLGWSLDHVGVFAKTVEQAAVLTDIMAGTACTTPRLAQPLAPSGVQVVIPQNFFFDILDPGVAHAFNHALKQLSAAGVSIVRATAPELDLAPTLQFMTLCAEAGQLHLDRALLHPGGLGEEVRTRLEAGQFIRAVDYIKAQRLRTQLRQSLTTLLDGPRVLLTPTVPVGAPKLAPRIDVGGTTLPIHPALTRLTMPFNLTGMPAISIPCGTDADGFPVGLQIAAPCGDDAFLLQVARSFTGLLEPKTQ
jgi:aspartyl-tRNA(Asn)/glutamyl-tRNA(Gln) amidotransferase subunit A